MSAEFDSRKDSNSTKSKQRPQMYVKQSFRELCDSKSSGFANMAIFRSVKYRLKIESEAMRLCCSK